MLALLLLIGCGARDPANQVIDVTRLVRVDVDRVVRPRDPAEVVALLQAHDGPVSIGGGRFSMGGQTASNHTLHLDLREMNDIVAIDPENRTVTVEAGATWRGIQEALDPLDLSVQIMQSYANFTVGGSMSVNGHGRYVNQGPLVHSVASFDLALADGTIVHCSRDENPELFFGAIGGYGALGVITTATLHVDPNVPVERTAEWMDVGEYREWFTANIAGSQTAVFHNADLYPPDYTTAVAITFSQTDAPVTVPDRLQPGGPSTFTDRTLYWAVMDLPGGKEYRRDTYDPKRLAEPMVVWRNYEASYDARGLEPASRDAQTYVLQEYFVPVDRLMDFVPKMAEIFQAYDVDVANVSIRHAKADPDTLLSWAPTESYAFVIYYRQGTAVWDRTEVGIWTRALIDAAIDVGGTYYLPYQPVATEAQFHAAYPRANDLFALKFRVDPDYRFRNTLWDTYLPPPVTEREAADAEIGAQLAARSDWKRPEDQTLLTLPEWDIVYAADELGAHLQAGNTPQSFPFFAEIGQFWQIYSDVSAECAGRYPTNTGYHGMIWVIGLSYTVEYAVLGAWENTIGALTLWWDGGGANSTPEDQFLAQLATDYGAFIHHTPWYAFPWWQRKADLAKVPKAWTVRRQERRFLAWSMLWLKGLWGDAMGAASSGVYGPEATTVYAWARRGDADPTAVDGVTVAESLGDGDDLLSIPRYEPFTTAVPELARHGVELVEISGNTRLLVQLIADDTWADAGLYGPVVTAWPILTQPGKQRITLLLPVDGLHEVIPALDAAGVQIEHLYDY